MLLNLLRDSAFYGAANIVARGMVFLLLPIYTKVLTHEEVGVFEWISAASMTLMALLPLEITQSIARIRTLGMSTEKIQLYDRSAFGFTALVFIGFALVVMVVVMMISIALKPGANDWILKPKLLLASVVLLLVNGMLYFLQNELRWSNRADQYALTSIATATITTLGAVTLLLVFKIGILGLYAALILGSGCGFCVALHKLPHLLKPRLHLEELTFMLQFSFPLALSSGAIILATTVDRLMIAHFLDLDALGLYGVAMRVAAIAMLALQGFQLAVLPAIVKQDTNLGRTTHLEKSFRFFLLVAISVALLLSSIAPWLVGMLTSSDYQRTQIYIPIILIGTVACAIYPFAPGLWIKGHSWRMALLGIGLVGVGFLLSWWLIPLGGIMGAASAYTLTGMIYGSIMILASDRVLPVERSYRKLMLAFGLFVLASISLAIMSSVSVNMSFRILGVLLIVAPISLLLTNVSERKQLSNLIRRKRS